VVAVRADPQINCDSIKKSTGNHTTAPRSLKSSNPKAAHFDVKKATELISGQTLAKTNTISPTQRVSSERQDTTKDGRLQA
jgi:hypothetical protein